MMWWMVGLAGVAGAGELAGVTLPDSVSVGGQSLVLNGMGLREKYFIDVYVGGLYLPSRSTDDAAIIGLDAPKRIVMHFVYSAVPKDKINETFTEGFASVPGVDAAKVAQLKSWMADCTTGDEIVFDYVPGEGTAVTVKGQDKGSIQGADFMRGLWTVYLGPNPPTAKFKRGLLGS